MKLPYLVLSLVVVALLFKVHVGVGIVALCFLGAWLMPWQPLGTRPQPIVIRNDQRRSRR